MWKLVAILVLCAAAQLVMAASLLKNCDRSSVDTGSLGSMLRVHINVKECVKNVYPCLDKFDVSLARGELYRTTNFLMRSYGQVLGMTHAVRGVGVKTSQTTCPESSFNLESKIPKLTSQKNENCTKYENSTECNPVGTSCTICSFVGEKAYFDITVKEAQLSTEVNNLAKIASKEKCTFTPPDKNDGDDKSVMVKFEDCLNVTLSDGSVRHLCNEVGMYDKKAQKTMTELKLKNTEEYDELLMLAYDQYFTVSYEDNKVCLGSKATERSLIRPTLSGDMKDVSTKKCKNTCYKSGSSEPRTFVYYTEKWDKPKPRDSNTVKYIKINVKGGDFDKENSGNVLSSGIVKMTTFIGVMCTLLMNY